MGGITRMIDLIAQYITKKRILIGLGVLFGLIILIAGLSGGIVVVKSPKNESVQGYLKNSEDDSEDNDSIVPIEINKDSWSIYYQPSGDYYFNLNNEENSTVYQRSVGMFSITNIDVKFEKQKQTKNLGYGNFDCAVNDQKSSEVIYYYCDKILDNEFYYSQTHDGVSYIDHPAELGVKPYNGTLVQVGSEGGGPVVLSRLSFSGTGVEKQKFTYSPSDLFVPETYKSTTLITDSTVAENTRLILYDDNSNKIEVYSSATDKPYSVDISQYINSKDKFSNELQLIGNTLYIFSGFRVSDNMGEEQNIKDLQPNQKIIAYNIDTKKVDSQINIPENLSINSFTVSTDKKIAMNAIDTISSKEEMYIYENKKFNKLAIAGRFSDEMCWMENKLVYLAKDGGQIYTYNLKQSSSSLIYENPSDTVVGLGCTFGKIYFPSLGKDSQSSQSDYRWFELLNDNIPKKYTKPESVFPIIDDSLSGISWSYIFRDTIYVHLDSSSSCTVTDNEKTKALKYLKLLRINTALFTISFSKDC